MNRLPLLAVLALLCALPAPALRVRLTDADGPSPRVAIHTGDELRIDLATQPAAGYHWTVRQGATAVLTEVGHATHQDGAFSPTGTQSFVWRAFTSGSGSLRLDYGRGYGPEKSFTVDLSVADPPLAQPSVQDQSTTRRFTGTLACADCTGIRRQLILYGDDASPGRPFTPVSYLDKLDYAELPGQPHIAVQTGVCKLLHGDPANANATLYALEPGPAQPTQLYLVDRDRLIPVDAQGVPLPTPPGSGPNSPLHQIPQP